MEEPNRVQAGIAKNLGALDAHVHELSARVKRLEDNYDRLFQKTIDKLLDERCETKNPKKSKRKTNEVAENSVS